jgi:predicted RNA-binding protein YlqC (UPF0109 family)
MREQNQTTQQVEKVKGILGRIVEDIIFHADCLKIDDSTVGNLSIISILTHYADKGRVIGTDGKTFKALKVLVGHIGRNLGLQISLDRVGTSVDGPIDRYGKFKWKREWDRERILGLCLDVCKLLNRGSEDPVVDESSEEKEDGSATTIIKIILHGADGATRRAELQDAMFTIFNAIGRKNGRLLSVAFVSELESTSGR